MDSDNAFINRPVDLISDIGMTSTCSTACSNVCSNVFDPDSTLISATRLRELEYIERNTDEIVKACALEQITKEATYKSELNRLKRMAKKKAHANTVIEQMNAYFNDIIEGRIDEVRTYIENGGIVSVRDSNGDTGLHISVRDHHDTITMFLLDLQRRISDTSLVNMINSSGNTPLHIACMQRNTHIVEQLLKSGADPNIQNDDQSTPLHLAVIAESSACVKLLLASHADILLYNLKNETPFDIAKTCEIKTILQNHRKRIRIWSGWSYEDIQKMDMIFTDQALNYSFCPICLKFFERSEGCIYMSHNCLAEGRTVHSRLFDTFNSTYMDGELKSVQWCSICNRITHNNRHYTRTPHDNTSMATLSAPGNVYDVDCRISNSGGGISEKYTRFMELRKCAYELIDSIGKISEANGITQLVESMWNAPFIHKKPTIAPWKLKSVLFPLRSEMPVNEQIVESIPVARPDVDKDLLPEIHESGRNCVSYDTRYKLIQFKHRMADGTVNLHDEECINVISLFRFIRDSIHRYKTGLDCESIGYCWNRLGGCSAVLYPEEIQHAMLNLECDNDEYTLLFSEYKACFYEKFMDGFGTTVR